MDSDGQVVEGIEEQSSRAWRILIRIGRTPEGPPQNAMHKQMSNSLLGARREIKGLKFQ